MFDDESKRPSGESDTPVETSSDGDDTEALVDDDVWREPVMAADTGNLADVTTDDLIVDDPINAVRSLILEAAAAAGVKAVFAEGRRSTDVTLVLLKGDRFDVLALAPNLVEEQQLDLKVMRSDEVDGVYELMLAVTDKLEAQAVNHPECRHKLLRFVQTELAKDEDSWSQGR